MEEIESIKSEIKKRKERGKEDFFKDPSSWEIDDKGEKKAKRQDKDKGK